MPRFELASFAGLGCLMAAVASAQTEPGRFDQPEAAAQLAPDDRAPRFTPTPAPVPHGAPVANGPGSSSPSGERPASFVSPPNRAAQPAVKGPALPRNGGKSVPSLPLDPRREGNAEETPALRRSTPSLLGVLGGLAMVLGLFFVLAWFMKRGLPKSSLVLPTEVVEMLGRAPLAARQQLHLLRIGNKLLLVCISAAGTETLTEITDPVEVDRLAGLCQQTRTFSSTNAFRQAFQHFAVRRKPDDAETPDASPDYASLRAEGPHA